MVPYFIYAIENIINNKIYIGQTINMRARWTKHKSDAKRIKLPLYYSLNKYGVDNFIFYLLEVATIDTVDNRERFYIKFFNTTDPKLGYNIDEGGQENKIFSESHRKKISIANSGTNNGMYGKTHTEETKKFLRDLNTGRKPSLETREKMSKSHQNPTDEYRLKQSVSHKGRRCGEKSNFSKLNNILVLEIRYKFANGQSRKSLAVEYSVSKSTINLIVTRKTWTLI